MSFEKSEVENCLNILQKHIDERTNNEITELADFLKKIAFFSKIPCKYTESRDQEINSIIQKCIKYLKVISLNSEELVIERGRKIEYIYLILRGKIGLYASKTSEEIQTELDNRRKKQNIEFQERGDHSESQYTILIKNHKIKLEAQKKLRMHKLGSLAKENLSKFYLKGEIYTIKEINEVLPGYHLFENAIGAPQISEYTALAKESSDLIAISVSDFHHAIRELLLVYKHRYKLLQKNFLTADEVSLNKLSIYFSELKFSSDEVVFKEGDNSDNLYCVASGEIHLLQDPKKRDVVARGASYLYGYRNLIDTVLAGDFFGDELFFGEKQRRYMAVVKSEGTVLLCLNPTLLASLSSHHSDIIQRLRNLLEMKREVRRKKNDHLDKKRARDYRVNLSDFKSIFNFQRNSPSSESAFKSINKKPDLRMSILTDTPPKASNVISSEQTTICKESGLKSTMILFSSPQRSKLSSLANLGKTMDNFQIVKPGFKCKIPPGSTIQKSKIRKASMELETSGSIHQQIPLKLSFNRRLSSLDAALDNCHNVPKNDKTISRNKLSPKRKNILLDSFEFENRSIENEKNKLAANKRVACSIKEQISSLTNISSKIAELSTAITNQLYLMSVNGSHSRLISHKHSKSTQIIRESSNYWDEKNQELEAITLEYQQNKSSILNEGVVSTTFEP